MDRWEGKVAFVSGASSGMGAAIATELVKQGLQVVGVARRLEKLESLQTELANESGKFYPIKCDMQVESDIINAFDWAKSNLGGVDILVNCAGLAQDTNLTNGDTEKWRTVFDTNVLSLCIATREAVKSMKERSVRGHIIHLNSVCGHVVIPSLAPLLNVYSASKYAVRALAETLRYELESTKDKIKVTNISPGYVKTEFQSASGWDGHMGEWLASAPFLIPKNIVDAVVYVLGTPENVNITELTMYPI